MDNDFIKGTCKFYQPHLQFKEPSLKGYILMLNNKDLYLMSQLKESQKISLDKIYLPKRPAENHRLLKADTSYPIWVVDGMVNEEEKHYTLIDGKHRVHILKDNGHKEMDCIVFSVKEIKNVLSIAKAPLRQPT